jgi:hypothetical protein
MDSEIQKIVAMVCLGVVAVVGIVAATCDFAVVMGCAGAIAALGGVAFGQATVANK